MKSFLDSKNENVDKIRRVLGGCMEIQRAWDIMQHRLCEGADPKTGQVSQTCIAEYGQAEKAKILESINVKLVAMKEVAASIEALELEVEAEEPKNA